MRALRLALLAALGFAAAVPAATLHLTLDPATTRIDLSFHATFHTVEGALSLTKGEIDFDPDTGFAAGEIVIDMASATTGIGRRDRKMHGRILQTDAYPQAVYHVERVEGGFRREGGPLMLRGKLDLLGSKHQVDIFVDVTVHGDQVTGIGSFVVPYIDWGIADPSFFIIRVARQVTVDITASGKLVEGTAAAALKP